MAQEPQILLSFDDDGAAVVLVDGEETSEATALLEMAPGLRDASNTTLLAKAINHLAHEQTYTVIEDPAEFADWYKQRLATEDPKADWVEGTFQLSNYETPDFDVIKKPCTNGDVLTFFAINRLLGAVYVATAPMGSGGTLVPDYEPLVG